MVQTFSPSTRGLQTLVEETAGAQTPCGLRPGGTEGAVGDGGSES